MYFSVTSFFFLSGRAKAMCGIPGIASSGRCGGPWGTQLGTDPWTEELEGRE